MEVLEIKIVDNIVEVPVVKAIDVPVVKQVEVPHIVTVEQIVETACNRCGRGGMEATPVAGERPQQV